MSDGRYRAYPKYKATGAAWLESVPESWKVFDGKRIFESCRETAHSTDEQLAASQKFGVVPQSLMMELNDAKVMLALKGTSTFRHVEKHDFVISLRSFEGGIEYSAYTGCVSPAYTVLRATIPVVSAYYKHLFKSRPYISALQATTDSLRDGKAINYEQFGAIPLILPPLNEQTQIAKFLDHETARIDRLIEKQEALIRLLKEKRQAVISHAVTKGLNPHAPLKDSCIPWLGQVPAHWEVKKFNHCASIRNGQVDPRIEPYRSMVLYAPNHIEKETGRVLYRETAIEQGADSGKYLCVRGEVIYSKIRPALAKAAICVEDRALCSADMYPMTAENGLSHNFLLWFLLTPDFTAAAVLDSERVAMPKINRDKLGDYKIPVPPLEEQAHIIAEIERIAAASDGLIERAEAVTALLQERRTALISAAVTGKIDVRHWQQQDSAAACAN